MGHKTLIDGVGYDITGGRCLVDGVGYSIQKGRTLVGGVGYDVAFGPSGTPAGDLAVGSSVYANVNGTRTEFLVVHQGVPSSIYDTSCDGTWLLMKNIYEKRAWHSSAVNDYGNSTIHSYLNSTFIGLFDANIQSAIKQVKLPYRKGSGSGTGITSGASGLAAKTFLLSGVEVNWSSSTFTYFPNDGACLSYFFGCATTDSKRIAYLNGSATIWWLRSPCCSSMYGATRVLAANVGGNYTNVGCTGSYGIRPAFVLDSNTAIDPDTFDILG